MTIDGGARFRNDRARGIVDRAVRPRTAQDDVLSTAAEAWFGRLYGLESQVRTDRPRPCNFVVGKAHLGVSHTRHDNGGLLRYAGGNDHWCLAYVLVTGEEGWFRMAGWTWGHLLRASWNAALPRPAFYLPQEDLRPSVDVLMAATFGIVRP
jgi:hypothetical protein